MKPVALVTGGSRGIGFGVALELARRGFDLAINGRRPAGDVADAVDQLRAAGAQVLYLQADVAERAQHARMVDAIRGEFGRLNVLVNNAGVAPDVRADILDATEESFDRLIRINLRGPYFLTQTVAKWMIEQSRQFQASAGSGAGADRARFVIVNVSSISAEVASVNRGDYCISKAGVAMATRLWAVRLAEFGIDVFEVRPGIVATDMTAGVRERYDQLIAGGLTLQRRWGEPADVGRCVAMLARGELTYATGQVLTLDGGLSVLRL